MELGANGGVVAVRHPERAGSYLLSEDPSAPEAVFHESAYRWGTAFVIADRPSGRRSASHRFDAPDELGWRSDGVDLLHHRPGLELSVSRTIETSWTDRHELRNTGAEPLTVGSLAVSTPWRDTYFSAVDSLRSAVHAHLWTGGRDSWVWAQPMDGSGPGLGLVLTAGRLDAYSVESRDITTSSNIRGHLFLHVTDHARQPTAMGGQRPIVLEPGESYGWSWQLDWYADLADFTAHRTGARPPLIQADRLAVPTGESITLRLADGATAEHVGTPAEAGVHHLWAERDGERSRVAVLVHAPLRTVVETRIRFVLDHQRASERGDVRRAAFVPYDNRTGLTVRPGAWTDWNDSRERVGTAQLLQQARRLGWGDRPELVGALSAYEEFVRATLIEPDGLVADDSRRRDHVRLYNCPWFARFLLDQGDLDAAVAILDRYYADGGAHFLAFDLGPLLRDVARRLRAAGRVGDADRMRDHLLGHAAAFLAHGEELPAHEVNYEQSMVAPLVDLLLAAHLTDPEAVPADELTRRLRWLTAFAADQPDVRLRSVPIRHWDGFWFGGLRLWGDVYPHYWSSLSAAVFLAWPSSLASATELASLRRAGEDILAANLTGFFADGSATCAFVYPSCVNGQPAHVADPLANDQDWALVYALRRLEPEGVTTG